MRSAGCASGRLLGDLVAVDELVDDLDDTVPRRTRSGQRIGSGAAEIGLPFNAGAAEARDDLRNALSTGQGDHRRRRARPPGRRPSPAGAAVLRAVSGLRCRPVRTP
ncbi:hypothetical protein [Saccharothrix sp.]|uniref:hypothetical protein n=1 Tax=Saccharothrix sp. TaxID=1873460 RepID=UPI0028117981|nr:hypothetical protein [Saccharothrix sp.]